MTFQPREPGEPMALHLYRNAEALGADRQQRAVLREAEAMSRPHRSAADRAMAGRMADQVRTELKASYDAIVFAAEARGEKVTVWNDEGARRVKGRDGLWSLIEAGTIDERLANTALVYRGLFEVVHGGGVGSQLGQAGELQAARTSVSAQLRMGLHRAHAGVTLTHAETALGSAGRVVVLRAVVGEGRTMRSLSDSGHARKVMTADLIADLDRVRYAFANPAPLRITGQ
jgi:hypothetical protein